VISAAGSNPDRRALVTKATGANIPVPNTQNATEFESDSKVPPPGSSRPETGLAEPDTADSRLAALRAAMEA
jgi:hypothetical protein